MLSTLYRGVVAAGGLLALAAGCADSTGLAGKEQPRPNTILLAQAQFTEDTDENGQPRSRPGAARLVILRQVGQGWKREVLEDPESNVFHKAIVFRDRAADAAAPGIMTIGANAAALKLWARTPDGWSARTLWQTTFGGKQNRLRDFEIGDITADGKPDIAIATHDQGVVAVLTRSGESWSALELDRKPKTFVHEVELGDLDADGTLEIYATPSRPNRLDGTPQPGEIVAYHHTPDGFQRRAVEQFPLRHVKEILVTELTGAGGVSLLAAVEAELGQRTGQAADARRTLVRQYRLEAGRYTGQTVCTLPDAMCRFLNAGDVDGDGKPEVIASTHKAGIWLLRPAPGEWKAELIDKDSSGFEHATVLADLDGDGVQEIYVAADAQRQVRRYRWTGADWSREVIYKIEDAKITFGISAGSL
jgi:hypothetical protein